MGRPRATGNPFSHTVAARKGQSKASAREATRDVVPDSQTRKDFQMRNSMMSVVPFDYIIHSHPFFRHRHVFGSRLFLRRGRYDCDSPTRCLQLGCFVFFKQAKSSGCTRELEPSRSSRRTRTGWFLSLIRALSVNAN
jgi:hypothetical protein